MQQNILELDLHLEQLKNSNNFSAVRIITRGVRIHLLKENSNKIYCLLVPNDVLDSQRNKQLIDIGFNEKFPKINYDIEFLMCNRSEVIDKIVFVLNNILDIEKERSWRFEINPEMAVIKANEPEVPIKIRRQIHLKQNISFIRRFAKFIFSALGFSIMASIVVFLIFFQDGEIIKSLTIAILTIPTFYLSVRLQKLLKQLFNADW